MLVRVRRPIAKAFPFCQQSSALFFGDLTHTPRRRPIAAPYAATMTTNDATQWPQKGDGLRPAAEPPLRPDPMLRLMGREMALPRSRLLRTVVGVLLILFGLLGFLPVLGFWMVPLGLVILANDFPAVRRFNRRANVWVRRKVALARDMLPWRR